MHKEPPSEDQPVAGKVPEDGDRESQEAHAGFREPLGDNAVEQLRRYQSITLPPDARAAFLSAKLPGAAPELLYDTLPPHLRTEHEGGPLPLPETEPAHETEFYANEPADTGSETPTTTTAASNGPDRHLRGIAIVGGILFILALLLGWATLTRDSEIQAALRGAPAKPPLYETARSASPTQSPPTAAIATEPTLTPEVPTPSERKPAPALSEAQKSQASVTHPAIAPTGHVHSGVSLAPPAPSPAAQSLGASEPSSLTPAAPTSPVPAPASSGKKFRLGSR